MKTVFIVYFDCEVQCVAETYEDLADYLLKDEWVNEDMVYEICEDNNMDKPDDIERFVREMTWEEFNNFFNDYYYIERKKVYKKEE